MLALEASLCGSVCSDSSRYITILYCTGFECQIAQHACCLTVQGSLFISVYLDGSKVNLMQSCPLRHECFNKCQLLQPGRSLTEYNRLNLTRRSKPT